MTDWTAILAALGVPALWVGPLILLIRAGWPFVVSTVRVWMMDRGLRRAAGFMHSLRVAAGTAGVALDDMGLASLVTRGCAYMGARLPGTIAALKIPAADLRDMVQAEYGTLLSGLPTRELAR